MKDNKSIKDISDKLQYLIYSVIILHVILLVLMIYKSVFLVTFTYYKNIPMSLILTQTARYHILLSFFNAFRILTAILIFIQIIILGYLYEKDFKKLLGG